jgi:hypothetical protein
MTVGSALEDLIGETLDFLGRKGSSNVSHVLLEIKLTVLKYQVQFVLRIKNFF